MPQPARVTIVLLAAILSACSRRVERAHPPVIIISVDTLRSDHLPVYGSKVVQTPAIDALAHDSIVFDRAYSHCPLTLPSHATILTGQLPATTGIRDNLGFQLSEATPTLATLLKSNGYRTGAAVSAYVLRAASGIDRGFEFYDGYVTRRADQPLGALQRSGVDTVRVAEKWLEQYSTEPPFLFLHLYEPHSPYEAPEPFRGRYAPYDAEIAYVDSIVGQFIESLRKDRLYDRALIIFLSDHGEGLGDHGEQEHGLFLYREAIQVPLMIKLPDSHSGSHDHRTAGLSDVMPTVLAALGIDPPAGLAGQSLLAKSSSPRNVYSETFYPRFHFGWSEGHSLTDGAKHYVQTPSRQLYDLGRDPAEKTNLATEDRRSTAAFQSAMTAFVTPASSPQPVSAEERAKLAALGYVSGNATASPGEVLPDPTERGDTLRALRDAYALFHAGRNAETAAALQPIVRENPHLSDAWEVMAKALWRLRRDRDAIAAAKEGLRHNPQSTELAATVAEYMLRSGSLDDAEHHAEAVVIGDPARGHELLARIYLARGGNERAEGEARAAFTSGGGATALVTLARALKQQNRYVDALNAANEAARTIESEGLPQMAGLSFLRGDLLARLGQNMEAERALRNEIAIAPGDPRAYQSLIFLLASEQRGDEATKLIHQLIDTAPSPDAFATIIETLNTLGDRDGVRYWARQGLQRYPKDPRIRKFAG